MTRFSICCDCITPRARRASYAARGRERIAEPYLRNASDCYRRWGTDGKVISTRCIGSCAKTVFDLEHGRIVLHVGLPEAHREVLGDRVQLQQVLLNLMRNGIEAMSTASDPPC